MPPSKHVAVLIASLITLHSAQAQFTSIVTSSNEAFTSEENLTGVTATSTDSAPVVAQSTITSAAPEPISSTAAAGDLSTVTITAAPEYQNAPSCLQDCLYHVEFGFEAGLLPELLGCGTTVYNACYCTSAEAKQASSIISSCISEFCGTGQISDAISVYGDYCTSAGYPSNANVATTSTGKNSQVTLITNNIVITVPYGSSTLYVTESAGVQTETLTSPSSSANTNPSTASGTSLNKKFNIGAIVGGIVGALVLIAALVVLFIWLHRQKAKEKKKMEAGEGSTFVPTKGPGRAELPEKGIPFVGVGEKEVAQEAEEPVNGGGGVEIGGREVQAARYGLRPEELDSEGRYVGELHGDGRQFGGVELQGSEVVRKYFWGYWSI